MAKVTVVGSYIVALVMDLDRIPLEGETVRGRNFHQTHGGKGSNMAAAAARLGAEAAFLGKIGRDAYGDAFLDLLRRESVDPAGVLRADSTGTAVGIILFSVRGTNAIAIDLGANAEFSPADVEARRDLIESAGAIVSPLEIPLETALAGAAIARRRGVPAVLNPAPALDLRGADLANVFALTPNETEARICAGRAPDDPIDDRALARELLGLGPEHVMITRGAKGVLWACRDGLRNIPALPVRVVDTVGAGDAFNAGLAVGLAERRPVAEAVALGVTAASLSTEKRETIESYPRRPEVDRRIEDVMKGKVKEE
jgi:ribokinase